MRGQVKTVQNLGRLSIKISLILARARLAITVEIDAVDLLERGYLRHVQNVANADGVRIEFQAAVAIDSEVAERMRVRVRRPRQRKRYQREDRDSDRGGRGA